MWQNRTQKMIAKSSHKDRRRGAWRRGLVAVLLLLVITMTLARIVASPAQEASKEEVWRLASFNIRTFGRAKMRHPFVVAMLARIVSNFDLVAIQELRDKSQSTVPRFVQKLNTGPRHYKAIVGPRLGRTRSKEQYVFLYRPKIFAVQGQATYPDPQDHWHREPLAAKFRLKGKGVSFVLLNVHVDPDEARQEIKQIPRVFAWAQKKFKAQEIIFMGDLNADCRYYKEEKLPVLARKHGFELLTPNSVDTTEAKSSCSYDRILRQGRLFRVLQQGVVRFDGEPYRLPPKLPDQIKKRYPQWRRLMHKAALRFRYKGKTRRLKPKRISDHYPIFVDVALKE